MDRQLKIATGRTRYDARWKNTENSWTNLLDKLSKTTRTRESYFEYTKMSKDKQSKIKDVGGFVGGHLKEGRRKNGKVLLRSLITLDADYATKTFWNDLTLLNDFACCIYSTHKHKTDSPRLRLVVPLERDVTPEEYEAIARRLAADIGIELFDDTTYQPTRLMYWPSTADDAEFVFEKQDGDWLNPDEYLNRYVDWSDASTWPQSSRVNELHKSLAKKQGDPTEKEGLIGAFCRTYSIQEILEKFLYDVYEPSVVQNRYTYMHGSTAAGVVTYNDMFIYSNHATDPASSKLCNGFDIVRIHKFGDLDIDVKEGTPVNRLPSFKAMSDFILEDEPTKKLMAEEKILIMFGEADATEEEKEQIKEDYDWMKELEVDKRGNYESTSFNFKHILRNDLKLKNIGGYNSFTRQVEVTGKLPWNENKFIRRWDDFDDAGIRSYIEDIYKLASPGKLQDAIAVVQKEREFNSVKDYLEPLVWDGQERIDLLLVDFLGAEDTSYTRGVTRKTLIGAVARIYHPGCKMDNSLILVGKQGTGKSTFVQRLAKKNEWYSDSLFTFNGKEALEAVQGKWIIELAELAAIKGSEIEKVKQFITKTVDDFRGAYKRNSESNLRQNIFIGSTNEREFLRDATGNRRFWPVDIGIIDNKLDLFKDFNSKYVDQVWAEAKEAYLSGEEWHADKELSQLAYEHQENHSEESASLGLIREYLERNLPDDWDDMKQDERLEFFQGYSNHKEGTYKREKVCLMEIWLECFGGNKKDLTRIKQLELSGIMKQLKDWEYSSNPLRFKGGYGRQKGYTKKAT
ncbi:virulence-associated E family protein [Anaerorhabdus sp.]|uniref:virulence-associated E family protein n=1 Tax=Anaerorhabdus sp. TaxID=1872524 RepID=UPI002FCB218E